MFSISCSFRRWRAGMLLLKVFLILTGTTGWFSEAAAEHAADLQTFSLYLENDTFDDTDRLYTNGLKLTWVSPVLEGYDEDSLMYRLLFPLARRCLSWDSPAWQRSVSISLGQEMYTPDDINATEIIPDDRPYAGLSYYQYGFHRHDRQNMQTLEFMLGLVGPHAGAEAFQSLIHHWTENASVDGWHLQLADEPILGVMYEQKKKWQLSPGEFSLEKEFGAELIAHVGGGVGNAFTYGNGGLEIRLGWKLPVDFGTFGIRPVSQNSAIIADHDPRFREPDPLGVHLFAGIEGLAVLRNITLDGNTFQKSHRVDKLPFVVNGSIGIGFIEKRYKITVTHFYRTREFETQEEAHAYWSLNISISY